MLPKGPLPGGCREIHRPGNARAPRQCALSQSAATVGDLMSQGDQEMKKLASRLALAALAAALTVPAAAQTEIQWWHSMGGALGEWVNDLAKDFNASQKDYRIVPTFKGSYAES